MKSVDEIRRVRLGMLVEDFKTVAALAAHLERSESQIHQWLKGLKNSKTGKPRGMLSKTCRWIESRCGKPSGWMDQDPATGDERSEAIAPAAPNTLHIAQLGVAGSMGFGEPMPDHENVISHISVEMDWVRKHLPSISSPSNLKVISGYGDSMAPTYNDGDILLVDTGVRSVMIDGVYVLSAHNRLYIKRVRQRMDGQFEVSSDNPTVKTVDVLNGEHEVTVHGRVMWAWNGRKL